MGLERWASVSGAHRTRSEVGEGKAGGQQRASMPCRKARMDAQAIRWWTETESEMGQMRRWAAQSMRLAAYEAPGFRARQNGERGELRGGCSSSVSMQPCEGQRKGWPGRGRFRGAHSAEEVLSATAVGGDAVEVNRVQASRTVRRWAHASWQRPRHD